MITGKELCKMLAEKSATVLIQDGFNEDGLPVFVLRKVVKAVGCKSGRNSYWCVEFNEPIENDCNGVAYSHVLGYKVGDFSNVVSLINRFLQPVADRISSQNEELTKLCSNAIIMLANS